MTRFHVDENVPRSIVRRLRANGHEVTYQIEGVRGLRDRDVLAEATSNGAIVLTRDQDFDRLVLTERQPCVGMIRLQLGSMAIRDRIDRTLLVIEDLGDALYGHVTIVYPGHVERIPLA